MINSQSHNYESAFNKVIHKRSDLHILRKLWHISTGSLGLYLFFRSGQDTQFWGFIALTLAITGFITDMLRSKFHKLNEIIIKFMGPIMRRSEKEGVTGLPFYALGVSLSLFFYRKEIAVLSIMFLVFSDPISSFFGVLYGKDKIMPNKSLQGAVAGFFACYLLTLFYTMSNSTLGNHILLFSVVAGVIGSLSELVSAFNIDDNLTIPVLSGLGMTVLNHFVTVFP